MNNMKDVETLLNRCLIEQKDFQSNTTSIIKMLSGLIENFKSLQSSIYTVCNGPVTVRDDEVECDYDWRKYTDETMYVQELEHIIKLPSVLSRMKSTYKLAKAINSCIESAESKHKKLDERCAYLSKSGETSVDYQASIKMRVRVVESIATLKRRMRTLAMFFFKCRRRVLVMLNEMTKAMIDTIDSYDITRHAVLKNDSTGEIAELTNVSTKYRKDK